jgi:small neutral amino acid transporter SnatA (MarC family)
MRRAGAKSTVFVFLAILNLNMVDNVRVATGLLLFSASVYCLFAGNKADYRRPAHL